MSEINISIDGGTSKRLLTAGKYCDKNIVVTAKGGSGGSGGSGGEIDKLINKTITEVSSVASTVGAYAFYDCLSLVSVDLPNATSVDKYAFYNCRSLASADIPNLTAVNARVFENCYKLTNANFPNATSVGSYAFYFCSSLETVNFPKATTIYSYAFGGTKIKSAVFPEATSVSNNSFQNCSYLERVDFSKLTKIGTSAFYWGYSLKTVIIRSDTVCTLDNKNAFSECHHFHGTQNGTYNPTGAKDGYIYVPSGLVDSYKSATNWNSLASQFRALEDYTVDGTTTGELDETKI